MLRLAVKCCVYEIIKILPNKLRNYAASQIENVANNYAPTMVARNTLLIEHALSVLNSGDYERAEHILQEVLSHTPYDSRIAPHISRIRFLKLRSNDIAAQSQTQRMCTEINSMRRELESHPIYVPGDFWNSVGKHHVKLLERYGVENFKRTVSHHYQNWLMCSQDDPQLCQLLKKWPTYASIEPWFNTIEIPDNVGLHPVNINTSNSVDTFENPTYPLAEKKLRELYRISVSLLWEFVKSKDSFNVLEELTESEIGNPIRIWNKGRLISSDIAHSVRERNMLLESLSLKGREGLIVGELGAGHGRLAEIFGRTTNFRHFIFDITPALFVSQWYIKRLFPNEKIFEFRHFDDFSEISDELQGCRFAFFTSNQIEKLPNDYLNLFINMNSLAEMQLKQIKNFLLHIDRITTGAFLSRQQTNSRNPVEHVHLSKADYRLTDRWQLILDTDDEIYPEFFNQIWKRLES